MKYTNKSFFSLLLLTASFIPQASYSVNFRELASNTYNSASEYANGITDYVRSSRLNPFSESSNNENTTESTEDNSSDNGSEGGNYNWGTWGKGAVLAGAGLGLTYYAYKKLTSGSGDESQQQVATSGSNNEQNELSLDQEIEQTLNAGRSEADVEELQSVLTQQVLTENILQVLDEIESINAFMIDPSTGQVRKRIKQVLNRMRKVTKGEADYFSTLNSRNPKDRKRRKERIYNRLKEVRGGSVESRNQIKRAKDQIFIILKFLHKQAIISDMNKDQLVDRLAPILMVEQNIDSSNAATVENFKRDISSNISRSMMESLLAVNYFKQLFPGRLEQFDNNGQADNSNNESQEVITEENFESAAQEDL